MIPSAACPPVVAPRLLSVTLAAAALAAASLVLPIAAADVAVAAAGNPCAAPIDTVPPTVSSLHLSKTVVDTTVTSATVTVTVTAQDGSAGTAPSGIDQILIVLAGPGSSEAQGVVGALGLTSGDAAAGTWSGRIRIPRSLPSGEYAVAEVDAIDDAGNLGSYSAFPMPLGVQLFGYAGAAANGAELRRVELTRARAGQRTDSTARPSVVEHPLPATPGDATFAAGSPTDPRLQPGWGTSLEVTAAPPAPKHPAHHHRGATPGTLTSFRVTPTHVDTVRQAARLHATATFRGHRPRSVEATFVDDQADPEPNLGFELRRHGDRWSGSTKIQRWSGRELERITLYARYTQHGSHLLQVFTPDRLETLGFPHTVSVLSGVDHTRPVLHSVVVSPTPIDATGHAARATVTARITDEGSGAAAAVAPMLTPVTEYGSTQLEPVGLVMLHRRGSSTAWTGTLTVHRCDTPGTYSLAVEAVDHAGNLLSAGPTAVRKTGSPSRVRVATDGGDTAPPTITATATQPGEVDVDFSAPVVNVTPDTLTVYDVTKPHPRYRSSTPVQAIACYDASGRVADCSGAADPVTSARLAVSGVVEGRSYEVWSNQGGVTTQLTSLSGYPMSWLSAQGQT